MNNMQISLTGSSDAHLRTAVLAYLARYRGLSRTTATSDLRSFLRWCDQQGLPPLQAQRPHIELFVRWMQEIAQLKPSTVAKRTGTVAGFFRTCVMDGLLERSPAEFVRRPRYSNESPTLGLTHLQFEAMLNAGRTSKNPNDFALVAMLGLLGLRIFEATGSDIEALDEVHGHRVLRVRGKGEKYALAPLPPAVGRRSIEPSTDAPADRSFATGRTIGWTETGPPGD